MMKNLEGLQSVQKPEASGLNVHKVLAIYCCLLLLVYDKYAKQKQLGTDLWCRKYLQSGEAMKHASNKHFDALTHTKMKGNIPRPVLGTL